MFDAGAFGVDAATGQPLAPDPAMQPARIFTRPAKPVSFVPWAARLAAENAPTPAAESMPCAPAIVPETVIDGTAREASARAEGVEEGYAIALMELADERQALGRLIASLDALTPEPPQALALLLAGTVGRLVRQIVGEVEVDAALLARRAEAVAAMVIDEVTPCRLRMHPADAARLAEVSLAVEIAADPHLKPGTVQLDCGDGWIEDGPDGAIERLATALDRMGIAR